MSDDLLAEGVEGIDVPGRNSPAQTVEPLCGLAEKVPELPPEGEIVRPALHVEHVLLQVRGSVRDAFDVARQPCEHGGHGCLELWLIGGKRGSPGGETLLALGAPLEVGGCLDCECGG